jgi:hypothetical protein
MFSKRANRPIRRDPFAGGVGQCCRDIDDAGCMVDGGCLHGGDLMLAQGLADNVEPTGERRVAKDLLSRTSAISLDGGEHGFLRIDQLDLRFGQRCQWNR